VSVMRAIVLLSISLLGLKGCDSQRSDIVLDGEPVCIRSAAGSCRTPFHALYAHPVRSYDGLVLRLTGCLREATQNRFLIFPDNDTARYYRREYALLIVPDTDELFSYISSHSGRCVVIDGRLMPVEGSGDLDDVWGELVVVKQPMPLSEEYPVRED